MLPRIFRSNSCIRLARDSTVHKQKSDKSLRGAQNFYREYDENRYEFLNGTKDIVQETHPHVSIAFDKCMKKKVVIKKCRMIKNELNSIFKFSECRFIEKIIHYDFLQKIVIYNYNENKDLSEYMQKYQMTIEQSTNVVLSPILQALEFIHEQGYAHRDIKPENILYYDDGCKLIDFEFCEPLPQCGYYSNRNGTLEFMAPEVTHREGCLESDIWSLGLVYYECIHKRLPYYPKRYDNSNYHQLFEQIRTMNIMINLDLDLSIIAIFKFMLNRNIKIRKNCYHKIYALIKSIDWRNTDFY